MSATVQFDRTVLINLDRRPDRLESFGERFPARAWPFPQPERVAAIDGERVPAPAWWTQQPGAWGCLATHRQVYEQALNRDENVFIFEDDCVFAPDFGARLTAFLAEVPADWDMLYLGGLHRMPALLPPVPLSDHVHLGRAITTTYAYGLSHRFLRVLYPLLMETEQHHIDQMLARLMAQNQWRVYCPVPWLVGMDAGFSDICGRVYQTPHWWQYEPEKAREPIFLNQLISRVELFQGKWYESPLGSQQRGPIITSTIGGWFTDDSGAVYRRECRMLAAASRGRCCRLVEVGCWRGRSLSYLADLINSGEVKATAVDTWQGNVDPADPTHGQDVYEDFTNNVQRLGMTGVLDVRRTPSVAAAASFPDGSLDCVHVDASHDYASVSADLAAWWPKIRAGGVMLLHDYANACACPDVARAIDDFADSLGLPVGAEAELALLRKP